MAQSPIQVKQQSPATTPRGDAIQAFRTEMDRLFDRFMSGFGMPTMRRLFDAGPSLFGSSSVGVMAPAVDVTEDDNSYKITAELPGTTEKEVEVNLSGDTLTIKGEKQQETERKDQNHYLSERSYGSFERSFVLPEDVEREKIEANFSKGVLTVSLPKNAKAKSAQKKIEVKAG
jgi:HSP20 family protein